MKTTTLLAFVFVLLALTSFAQVSQDFRVAANEWEILASKSTSSQETQSAFDRLLGAWQRLPQNAREVEWPRLAMIYTDRSQGEFERGNPSSAAKDLRTAGELHKQFGGRFEYATKSPDAFFPRLAKLQAGIAEATGADPLSGMVDYLFRKQGDRYIVARQEFDPEVKGVTIDGVAKSEVLAQVIQLSTQDGRARLEKTHWVIGPKGTVEKTLRQATREVSFDEDGRLSAKPLKAPVLERSPEEREAATPGISETLVPAADAPPTSMVSPSPAAPLAQAHTASAERHNRTWSWVVVGIAALAVIAMIVWKRRG